MEGKITIITGLCGVGKTAELIDIFRIRTNHGSIPYDAFKPVCKSSRGGANIVSRAKNTVIPCRLIKSAKEINTSRNRLIFIDEFSFLDAKDLKKEVKELKKRGADIYLCGLDRDFTTKYFEAYKKLSKIADRMIILQTRCEEEKCKKLACCSSLIEYGADNSLSTSKGAVYKPLCLKHHNKQSLKR